MVLEKFSKFDGTYPPLGNPNPLPEIEKCCDTVPNIQSYISGRLSCIPRNAIYIECPVCSRQSFKIWLPIKNKSGTPSEVQIKYWNGENQNESL